LKKNYSLPSTSCGDTRFRWGERTYIMGIINISPDSFSGDGLGGDMDAVSRQAQDFITGGADVIDVGGESTRPNSEPVSAEEEIKRVIPAIERLAKEITAPISIDTSKSEVAAAALQAGACIVNDVWGLKQDIKLADVAAEAGVPIILASNQRNQPCKGDIMVEIIEDLRKSIAITQKAGVSAENIIIDPGIGFGKTLKQNLEIIRRLAELEVLNKPILLGTSRKSVIGLVLELPAEQRLEGTAATVAIGIANGADIIRVHDVRQMVRVCRMSDAVIRSKTDEC